MNYPESSEDRKQINSAQKHDGRELRSTVVVSPPDPNIVAETESDVAREQPEPKPPKKKHTNWLAIIGAIALLFGGGFFAWRWWQTKNTQGSPPGQSQMQAIPVTVSTVNSSTIEESSEFVANLESRRSVTLLPQIQGRVSQIYVRPGDEVKAGTPLIQVNPEQQQAAVGSAQAAVAQAQAQVAQARASLRALEAQRLTNQSQLQLSQRQNERYSSLAQQGAVSREIREEYLNQLQAARSSLAAINQQIEAQQAALAQAQKAVQQAQANTRQAQVQLQYYQINAPFAGTVGDIPVKLGDLVTTSTQLTTVTQNQPLEVNVSIPRERAAQVQKGTLVELLNEQGEKIGESRVFFISPQTISNTQSVLIKALFENDKRQLRADSFVRARVIWSRRPGILVPTTAVSQIGGQSFVYVVQQAQNQPGQTKPEQQQKQPQLIARQKPVNLGDIQGNSYQVLAGLKPGERIVTSGLLNLRDGAPIAPTSAPNGGQGGQGGQGGAGGA